MVDRLVGGGKKEKEGSSVRYENLEGAGGSEAGRVDFGAISNKEKEGKLRFVHYFNEYCPLCDYRIFSVTTPALQFFQALDFEKVFP